MKATIFIDGDDLRVEIEQGMEQVALQAAAAARLVLEKAGVVSPATTIPMPREE